MNLLRGTLQQEDGWQLAMPHAAVPLGTLDACAGTLKPWLGRQVVAGVRPEDLQPASRAATLTADVEVVEPVGNEVFLNLRFGDQALVSRVAPSQHVTPGSRLSFHIDADRIHFFDAESGARIVG
jgi:multiple sugar transport system ATP-binding protein